MVKATDTSPALGRCCWQPPTAICSACGLARPCVHARGPKPLCLTYRGRRLVTCLDCGRTRPAHRRVTGGVLCAVCDRERGNTTGVCRGCCGTAPLRRDLCDACRLRERIADLQRAGHPHAVGRLAPYLAKLGEAPNPASTLRWLQSPARLLLEDLLAGRVAVSHAALDVAQGDENDGRVVGHVRAALVESGVLEPRDEPSASFARWQQRAIDAIAPGSDRGHMRAYATWHVAHELARANTQRRATPAKPDLLSVRQQARAAWACRGCRAARGSVLSERPLGSASETVDLAGDPLRERGSPPGLLISLRSAVRAVPGRCGMLSSLSVVARAGTGESEALARSTGEKGRGADV